jgi:hypothetical protein
MIVSGIVLSFISFFANGDITDGVLWYMAQALTYAGGIFGVSIYFKTKLGQSVNAIEHLVDRKFRSVEAEKSKDEQEDDEKTKNVES